MRTLIIIVIGLVASWYYTDLSADNGFNSLLAPLLLILCLISLALWLVLKAGFGNRSTSRSGINSVDDHGGGGDCGGGD